MYLYVNKILNDDASLKKGEMKMKTVKANIKSINFIANSKSDLLPTSIEIRFKFLPINRKQRIPRSKTSHKKKINKGDVHIVVLEKFWR